MGIDPDEIQAEIDERLTEYANELSGFMDVLPSFIMSMLELFVIFILEFFGELFKVWYPIVKTMPNPRLP